MANVVLMPAVVADAVDAVLTSWLVEMGDQVTKTIVAVYRPLDVIASHFEAANIHLADETIVFDD